MKTSHLLSTVESHTGGEPFRIITSGAPRIPGKTILERCAWMQENADEIRRAIMLEPRGHGDMYGGLLTEPVSDGADLGVIFMQNVDYSPHCGHGVIALATAAVELGWVDRAIPETRVGIDAPCGFIEAFVEWDGTHVAGVRFVNGVMRVLRRGELRVARRLIESLRRAHMIEGGSRRGYFRFRYPQWTNRDDPAVRDRSRGVDDSRCRDRHRTHLIARDTRRGKRLVREKAHGLQPVLGLCPPADHHRLGLVDRRITRGPVRSGPGEIIDAGPHRMRPDVDRQQMAKLRCAAGKAPQVVH